MFAITRIRRPAFTLVELLVVLAIVGLLLAMTLAVLGRVRLRAVVCGTEAQMRALEAGIESFAAQAGQVGYPPSRSDFASYGVTLIADPLASEDASPPDLPTSGAHLLVHALIGVDSGGGPDFRDLDADGRWADDTHRGPGGAYELDPAGGGALQPRLSTFVGDAVKRRMRSLEALKDSGVIVGGDPVSPAVAKQPLFTDAFERPILYYRAEPKATPMVANPADGSAGVYTQVDNWLITGADGPGLDFGGGVVAEDPLLLHRLAKTQPVPPQIPQFDSDGINVILTDPQYENTFARFVLNRRVSARNTPVRRDEFLLVSAGPDAIYGTNDDLINWPRE